MVLLSVRSVDLGRMLLRALAGVLIRVRAGGSSCGGSSLCGKSFACHYGIALLELKVAAGVARLMRGERGLPHEATSAARVGTSEGLVASVNAQVSLEIETLGKLLGTRGKRATVQRLAVRVCRRNSAGSGVGVGGIQSPSRWRRRGRSRGQAHGPIHGGGR